MKNRSVYHEDIESSAGHKLKESSLLENSSLEIKICSRISIDLIYILFIIFWAISSAIDKSRHILVLRIRFTDIT